MATRKGPKTDKVKHSGVPSEKKSISLLYSFDYNGIKVHVSQGYIEDVDDVDAIVNTALSETGHIEGRTKSIYDKAGINIIEECKKHVKKHGPLRQGEIVLTSAGKLKFKGIIHCVALKKWDSFVEKEEYVTKLNKTISTIFLEAEKSMFFKLAMPVMRADTNASTDFSIYAEINLKSIEDYSKMRPKHKITDIHFVDTDIDILLTIKSACERREALSSFQNSNIPIRTIQKIIPKETSRPVSSTSVAADSEPLGRDDAGSRTSQSRQTNINQGHGLMPRSIQPGALVHASQVIPFQETSENRFPCYKMNAVPRGICLIISNRDFVKNSRHTQGEDLGSRDGTEIDSEKLSSAFEALHFIVDKKDNLTDNEIVRALMDIACKNHSSYDCFVCCVLSHGAQGQVYGINYGAVEIKQLTSLVQPNSCPSLKDKPKLFFIQACQGPRTDVGFEMEADAVVDSERTQLIPTEADFLLGYSTVSGYLSYRLPRTGSLYIEKLVEMLNLYHKEMDLLNILTAVNDQVSKKDIVFQGLRVTQMPVKVSTLRKGLFLK